MNATDESKQEELRGREVVQAGERWGWILFLTAQILKRLRELS